METSIVKTYVMAIEKKLKLGNNNYNKDTKPASIYCHVTQIIIINLCKRWKQLN